MLDKEIRKKWQKAKPDPKLAMVRIVGNIGDEYRRKGTDYSLIQRLDAQTGAGGVLLAPKWYLRKRGVIIHEVQPYADLEAAIMQAEEWIREASR